MFVEWNSRHEEAHAIKALYLESALDFTSNNFWGPGFWIPIKGIYSHPGADWLCPNFHQGSTRKQHRGHSHWLFSNDNSEIAKYISPCMLGLVYLLVSLLTLGWNCMRCTTHCSQVVLGFGELDCKVHLVQFQLKSTYVSLIFKSADLSQSSWSCPPSTVRLNLI